MKQRASQSVAALYWGRVTHKRFTPKSHSLSYRVFTLFADLDDLPDIAKKFRFFGLNKWNFISFFEADYGEPKTGHEVPLKKRLSTLLNENGVETTADMKISVLTYPRVFGFSFNPITVFYCSDTDGRERAVIYEVRNTFGERHNYIFEVAEKYTFECHHETEKKFHVSPFFDRLGRYHFALKNGIEKKSVAIRYIKNGTPQMLACFSGKRQLLTNRAIIFAVLKMPFMTLKVVAGILLEASFLWLKGLKVFSHKEKHNYQSSRAQLSGETLDHQHRKNL